MVVTELLVLPFDLPSANEKESILAGKLDLVLAI